MRQGTAPNVLGCEFGPLCVKTLRPHFATLKNLDIRMGPPPNGYLVPELLASCPQLESLAADWVMSQDILCDRPWVCTRTMKNLTVWSGLTECDDRPFHNSEVLRMISKLTNLETLILGSYTDDHEDNIDIWRGLTQLKRLALRNCDQRLDAYDVKQLCRLRIGITSGHQAEEVHTSSEKKAVTVLLLALLRRDRDRPIRWFTLFFWMVLIH